MFQHQYSKKKTGFSTVIDWIPYHVSLPWARCWAKVVSHIFKGGPWVSLWLENSKLLAGEKWVLSINLIFIRPTSDHCLGLSTHSLCTSAGCNAFEFCSSWDHTTSPCQWWIALVNLSKLLHRFLYSITWICQIWYVDFSTLIHGFVKVATLICWKCYLDVTKLLPVFLALCQTKPSRSLTKISKIVEASVLNSRSWLSQSTQYLGSVVPLALFVSLFVALRLFTSTLENWCLLLCGHRLVDFWLCFIPSLWESSICCIWSFPRQFWHLYYCSVL